MIRPVGGEIEPTYRQNCKSDKNCSKHPTGFIPDVLTEREMPEILLGACRVLCWVLYIELHLQGKEEWNMRISTKTRSMNSLYYITDFELQLEEYQEKYTKPREGRETQFPENTPAVNSWTTTTTTTVMTAQIAFSPIHLNKGSIRYSKDTNDKDDPTSREWSTLLGSSWPTSHTGTQIQPGSLHILAENCLLSMFSSVLVELSQASISVPLPTWTLEGIDSINPSLV